MAFGALNKQGVGPWRSSRKYIESMYHSLPRYWSEITDIRNFADVYMFAYYKFPHLFPLLPFPPKITVEITNQCDLACPQCHRNMSNESRSPGFIEVAVFKKIIDEMTQHPGAIIKVSGWGEPALHPEFSKILDIIADSPVRSVVYTNGALLSRFSPAHILDSRIHTIVLSVDGTDAKRFARIRVGAEYEVVKRNLRALFEARASGRHKRPKLEINHTIFPDDNSEDHRRFKAEWLQICDVISFNGLVKKPQPKVVAAYKGSLRPCLRIQRELNIWVDGKVPLCGPQFRHGRQDWLGNVKDESITSLWRNSVIERFRKAHREGDLSQQSECKSCLICG
jgi:MoaA/NifB/PqqE/SkfB family radical SAM enzyme